MKNSLISVLLITILIFNLNCNLDINTTDPQSSTSLTASKKDNLFLCEYGAKNISNSLFIVKAAWIESSWKNKLSYSRVKKTKTGSIQLNLKHINADIINYKD